MMLTTPIKIEKSENKISTRSKVMTLGSCFSEHIGNKLIQHHFDCMANPFSTVFNPISLVDLLKRSIDKRYFTSKDLNLQNDRHFIYDLHSSYDSTDSQTTIDEANKSIKSTHQYLQEIEFLVITFGTSIGYYLIDRNELVSNCHKVPNKYFERRFIDDELMYSSVRSVIGQLLEKRADLQIILTVSPVRHTKEGLVDNSLSKSKLILLCHKLTSFFTQASYFPSFEIMQDELRDYRFYKEDMIHPSQQAVDFIWKNFTESYFDDMALSKTLAVQKLLRAYNHRAFNPESEGHQSFKRKQIEEIQKLETLYPEVDFDKYRQYFEK